MTIWDTLGIDRDSDRDTIRRAYARRLRQTNPEDDPEGFMQLRNAYDMALRFAGMQSDAVAPDEAPHRPQQPRDVPDGDHAEAPADALDQPSAEQLEIQMHAGAILEALAAPDPARWPNALPALEALLASSAMEGLELRRSVENWLAHQLASHAPRADILLDRAIDYFGWNNAGFRHDSPAIEAVLRRRHEQALAGQLQHPEHPLHSAWMVLQRRKAPSWLLRLQALIPGRRQQVHTLLLHMQNAPGLTFYLESDTLAWWRDYVSRPQPVQAFVFVPIAWLLVFVWLTAAQGRLVPVLADALVAGPLGLGAAFAYWFVTGRRTSVADRPRFATFADWAGATSPLTIPLLALALALPLSPWGPAVLAAFVALVLGLQDYALVRRPPQTTQRFSPRTYFTPIIFGFLVSVNVPVPAGLAWGVVAAGIVIGWYRGRYTLPVRLLRLPLIVRRLSFPFLFAAPLGLSWIVVRAAGAAGGYPLFLGIALGWMVLRIFGMAESNELVRRGMMWVAGFALIAFWAFMTPQSIPVSVVPPTVPMADQPLSFQSPNSPPPILWAGERAPECPTLRQDQKERPGAVGPEPCGTMRQWFRDTEYPPEAWDHQKSGLTRVRGTIGTDGRVSDCVILRGSGSLSLDETTCRLVEERARFMPARDAKGNPVPSRFVGGVDWRLRESLPDAPVP